MAFLVLGGTTVVFKASYSLVTIESPRYDTTIAVADKASAPEGRYSSGVPINSAPKNYEDMLALDTDRATVTATEGNIGAAATARGAITYEGRLRELPLPLILL